MRKMEKTSQGKCEIRNNDAKGKCYVDEPVDFTPFCDLNGKAAWSIEPLLPHGLSFDTDTGKITGVPVAKAKPKQHVVVASTNDAYAVSQLEIGVVIRVPNPVLFEYRNVPEVLPLNTQHFFVPHLEVVTKKTGKQVKADPRSCPFQFFIKPDLPAGLEINRENGNISGKPAASAPLQTYEVKAWHEDAQISTAVTFSVGVYDPPCNLRYPGLVSPMEVGKHYDLDPVFEGHIAGFYVEPELPAGLVLDEVTGKISGSPENPTPQETYYVTGWANDLYATYAELPFSVVDGAISVTYSDVEPTYPVQRNLELHPLVIGNVRQFSIEPALPANLSIDLATGIIAGTPCDVMPSTEFVVKGQGDTSECTANVTFAIANLPPEHLTYPGIDDEYVIGEPLHVEPKLDGGATAWSVTPEFPPGITLDKDGNIVGTPTKVTDDKSYKITASNESGSTDAVVSFAVQEEEPQESNVVVRDARADNVLLRNREPKTEAFADAIEKCNSIDMMPRQPKAGSMNWMVWMVHRAYLDDTTLEIFDFTNMRMPQPYVEPRVAPKLMRAMEWNTTITELILPNTNLQSSSVEILAPSLQKNSTLKKLNIENNSITGDALGKLADALSNPEESRLETLLITFKQYSPSMEKKIADMMTKNEMITKLGYYCQEPCYRHTTNNAIIRNVDLARRRRKMKKPTVELEGNSVVDLGQKTMTRLKLDRAPKEHFDKSNEGDNHIQALALDLTVELGAVPTKQQIYRNGCDRSRAVRFCDITPVLQGYRARLLQAMVKSETPFTVIDPQGTETTGVLKSFKERNDRWTFDFRPEENSSITFVAPLDIPVGAEPAVVEWLRNSPGTCCAMHQHQHEHQHEAEEEAAAAEASNEVP
eukprot:TRINITY_DN31099_c0_g1_i1.p1 TRINITY_DN31099_c0_g1~~TRINITY_DN31099_c0_g1_i1.p1  ORF type:complete len:960 (+),score=162.57 TRINITY_DN31099_c0_g1_i1:257-2881(+)